MAPLQAEEIFACLKRHEVDYVVIGGLAAVLHGSPPEAPSLEDVIRSKEAADRPKDQLALPLLRRLLDEIAKRNSKG